MAKSKQIQFSLESNFRMGGRENSIDETNFTHHSQTSMVVLSNTRIICHIFYFRLEMEQVDMQETPSQKLYLTHSGSFHSLKSSSSILEFLSETPWQIFFKLQGKPISYFLYSFLYINVVILAMLDHLIYLPPLEMRSPIIVYHPNYYSLMFDKI